MKLAVIIVNYNVKYFLEQAVASAQKAVREMQASHPGWGAEMWVVDNNSVDGSVEMVQNRFPEVRLIANKKNTGFSAANNQAIRATNAEYVLLLNPDTVVQEDTLLKTVEFMDAHPDAGGLGVMMIDGQGKFLPESKRGFPSPAVAFYKVFGLNRFFPKSKIFGRYHLGFLSKNETHEVDVLAGAFMLLRKSVLDKIGLLDETFFMYGEDIDLSYRIVKAGYKNYYFPHTRIIHYKGESTKKSSVNYVFVFYQAMVIFAKKHFPHNKAFLFSIIINIAIYLRAGVSIVVRLIGRLMLPIADFVLLYGAMVLLVHYWEKTIKYINGGRYPPVLLKFFIPLYIIGWMLGLLISGSYRKPFQYRRIFRGVLLGTLMVSIGYAFLSEHYRYSRAIIVLGAIAAAIVFFIDRLFLRLLKEKSLSIDPDEAKKIVVVGDVAEAERVITLLDKTRVLYNLIGYVWPSADKESSLSPQKARQNYVGNINQLDEIIEVYKVNEIIFCSKDIASEEIISWMSHIRKGKNVEFKIVPEQSLFVIGSNSKDKPGDYYSYEVELSILKPESRFNKRLFDLMATVALLITLPLNIWFVKNKGMYLRNIFMVFSGNKTWIAYSAPDNSIVKLPKLKTGVLSPVDELKYNHLEEATKMRLDYLYAKDYDVYKDLSIFVNGFSKLGQESVKGYEERNN